MPKEIGETFSKSSRPIRNHVWGAGSHCSRNFLEVSQEAKGVSFLSTWPLCIVTMSFGHKKQGVSKDSQKISIL